MEPINDNGVYGTNMAILPFFGDRPGSELDLRFIMNESGKLNGKDSEARRGQRRLGNQAIGERLRQMYDGVVGESVPEDFFKLLEQAEAKAKAGSKPRPDGEA